MAHFFWLFISFEFLDTEHFELRLVSFAFGGYSFPPIPTLITLIISYPMVFGSLILCLCKQQGTDGDILIIAGCLGISALIHTSLRGMVERAREEKWMLEGKAIRC